MNSLPAIPYLTIVKMFAKAHGLKFFTWADISRAAILYEETAKIKN